MSYMSHASHLSHSCPAAIAAKLAALRRAVRLWLALDGAAVLAAAFVLLAALSLGVDRYLRMDATQRALSLLLGLAALGFIAWRRLARPLMRPLEDAALGILVEARRPQLGERLISAIEFAQAGGPAATDSSPALVQAAIEAGVQAAGEFDFAEALDARRRRLNALALALAAGIFATAWAAMPGTMRLWFQRNILLLSRSWPQATHLAILGAQDGVLVCPRGDDLTVEVQADPNGVVPSVVMLRFRQPGGAAGSEPMAVVGQNTFSTTFRNVLEPFRFYVWGGDAETPWCHVRLVERPVVESLTLVCTPPAYVGKGPHPLPSDVGSYPVLAGSSLEVRGVASKPLASAELAFGKAKPIPMKPPAGSEPAGGWREFRATLAGETLQSGTYAIGLTDRDGLGSRQPARFALKVVPDQKPIVRARLEGIGDMVTPRAVVPVHARMSDDYAVVAAELVAVASAEGDKEPVTRRIPFGERQDAYGQQQAALAHRLELAPLGLSPGTHLTLHIEARDNDSVSGPKLGLSGTFSLRVVTEDELRNELLRREQEQRLEFERILADQQKLLENSRALEATLKRDPALAAKDRELLASSERLQRLIGGRMLAIAAQFTQILAEVENNRLESDPQVARTRLGGRIIEPLELLARRGVLQAADLLDGARKALPTADGQPKGECLAALADAAKEQDELVKSMREILKNMVKWEGYQEALNLLREVLKAQRIVNEETIKEYQRRIQKIFE